MPTVTPFKPMRPKGEAPRLMFENPMLASGTGAMPAGRGICADAWAAYSSRQRKLWQTIFMARRRAWARVSRHGTHRASRKNRRLGCRRQNGCHREERESGQGPNWGARKNLMPPGTCQAAVLSTMKFATNSEVVVNYGFRGQSSNY